MKGSYKVIVENKRIRYEFVIRRNITIIRGDSATGKTLLIDMIDRYYNKKSSTELKIHCDKICRTVGGADWELIIKNTRDSIIFLDESNAFIRTKKFAELIKNTDNYYVIVTRNDLPAIPYSVDEIYGLRESGKYRGLKKTYNEIYKIYSDISYNEKIKPEKIITEDSNSGFEFFKNSLPCKCISANGKSNIVRELSNVSDEKILIVADGAAFGPEMSYIMRKIRYKNNIHLFLPESFEWMILASDIIKDSEISQILSNPSSYIESENYFSWERFFTALLIDKTKDSPYAYKKKALNPVYLQKDLRDKIIASVKCIDDNGEN